MRFHPRLRFSAFPRRGRRTAPGSGEHKALLLAGGQSGIFPTSRVTGVDSDCTHGHQQSQQRESYQQGGLRDCYPSLTLVADKEPIFSRQNPISVSLTGACGDEVPSTASVDTEVRVVWNRFLLAEQTICKIQITPKPRSMLRPRAPDSVCKH